MKNLLRFITSASLSLVLLGGASLALTGCSADTLAGPEVESYTQDSTSGAGAGHNTGGQKTQDSTSGAGAGHNTGGGQ